MTTLRSAKRVRPIRQSEIAECGVASLVMVANYWGKNIELSEVRQKFAVTSRGTTLADLIKMAGALQMSTRPVRIELEHLHELEFPAILHWDMNHYVVAERCRKGRLFIVDPQHGSGAWHDFVSLGKHFTGVALEVEPTAGFAPEAAKRRLKLRELWGRTHGLPSTIAQAVVLSILLQIFVLATPYVLQIAIDDALPAGDNDLLAVLGLAFAAFAVLAGVAHAMRGFVLLSAGTMLSYAMSTNVARHMLRLPISWFERRSVGDVLSRFQSVQPLRRLVTEGMAAAVLDGAMAALTLGAMLIYSPSLTLIPMLSAGVYAAVRWATLNKEKAAEGKAIATMGREQAVMIETLRGVNTIRLAGHESLRQAAWQNRLTDMLSERYAHDKVLATQKAAAHLLEGLETVLVIWFGIMAAMADALSVGMLIAFAAWRLQFSNAARRVIDQATSWRLAKLHLERLSDIAFTREDPGFSEPESQTEALLGRIELRDIGFRYGDHEPLVVKNINLVIEPGENVVVTGPSGSGKSTLIKIVLGLIQPTYGELLIDGQPIAHYGRRAYRSQVGAVLQDDTLFTGSIADNVSGFTGCDPLRLKESLRGASVLADVERMPMRENTLVGDMGSTLSGGQKQRVLIARALYGRPRLLVLDEGTSHLDANHEAEVNETISRLGITRIGIAHRRETIEAANRVVTISEGRLEADLRKTDQQG
ncbi:peptidase domain-containing ABC transporter [Altericroceibacterium xinjiangense]|uniref:peptidase domain-containing ABC transporter n=1 Tax=Altericroceibacterium xinjiangense TaxID=762261 RepID=UPI001F4997CF|nr:peptidase domain-containing ABC transporter [Altericroceibacterium xinjiangense]